MTKFKPEGSLIDTLENKQYFKSMATLIDAFQKELILEAKAIVCDSNHNLIVDLGCTKGVIPRIEGAIGIEDGSARDIALISKVNKPVCFVITAFEKDNDGKMYPMLSRRLAQEKCIQEYISKLSLGDIIDAKITHLEPFGAFVDIGFGIPSLIPIDAISVSRISHPNDRFAVGDMIKAVVKSRETDSRISLTHKELLGSWEENASLFSAGETVAGIIRSVESYGIFVELTPNLAGLAEPKENAYPGQQASVYIKNLIPDKMKVKLIIVDSFAADYTPNNYPYFFDGDHMDYWRYSPNYCEKVMETIFNS
ncbi:MAG: S1 RNA-binding domain-containing protein [Oscillospiraceae bacterium]